MQACMRARNNPALLVLLLEAAVAVVFAVVDVFVDVAGTHGYAAAVETLVVVAFVLADIYVEVAA